ncbi:hypothetical protein SprV_0602205100 [Sparganum proliferum]
MCAYVFYKIIHALLAIVPKVDKLIFVGDFKVLLGIDHAAWKRVLGPHELGGCNYNGPILLCIYAAHRLISGHQFLPPSDVGDDNLDVLPVAELAAAGLRSLSEVKLTGRTDDQDDLKRRRLDG